MLWLDYLAHFFGGVFLGNAVPHVVSGMMGRSFQSPFAKPRGEGLSSPLVNVLWGFANLAAAYLLIFRVGAFDLSNLKDAIAVGTGLVLIALFCAYHFGRFNDGRCPDEP